MDDIAAMTKDEVREKYPELARHFDHRKEAEKNYEPWYVWKERHDSLLVVVERYENALRRLKLEAPHYKAEDGHLLAFVEGVVQAALAGTEGAA
jgi:hypothetical protein